MVTPLFDDEPIDEEALAAEWAQMAGGDDDDDSDEQDDEALAAEWAAMADGGDDDDDSGGDIERILDQSEIDSLLGVTDGDGSDLSGFQILLDHSKITYEKLPMLEVVFDRLIRLMSTSLRNFTSDNVELQIEEMTSVRFGDYLDTLPLPAFISVFRCEQWSSSALLTIDTSLIYSIVDVLLGGRKSDPEAKVEVRPFTTIERNLLKRMVTIILDDFTRSFSPIAPVKFKFDRLETNPSFATIVRPVNACLLIRVRLNMEERGGSMAFVIPYSTIEPVREILLQMFMGEKFGQDSIWETHFAQEVMSSKVSLNAVLDSVSMNLNDVLNWKKGSQIILKAKPDSKITLNCGDYPVYNGLMGQKDQNMAIKIKDNLFKGKSKL